MAEKDFSVLQVEVSPEVVNDFIQANRTQYLEHLRAVKEAVTQALRGMRVYKIYGRDERQSGDSLKDTRKVRLKFNKFHKEKGIEKGSLWDSPDIVGFTVVVNYPSEISRVASVIDDLVKQNLFIAENPPTPSESDPDEEVIISKFGRSFKKRGYFACHYNLRKRGPNVKKSPICEIQVKTVLFDAWGAKTHDLTYKASSEVSSTLIDGFELLGDTLAVLDLQSDTMRDEIQKKQGVREHYFRSYVSLKSSALLEQSLAELEAPDHIVDRAYSMDASNSYADFGELRKFFGDQFNLEASDEHSVAAYNAIGARKKWSSVGFFCCALRTGNQRLIDEGREFFAEWISQVSHPVAKLHAYGICGLANLFALDFLETINECEEGIEFAQTIMDFSNHEEKEAYLRRRSSIHSSLAYVYALIIGSHEGNQVRAEERSLIHLQEYYSKVPAAEVFDIKLINSAEDFNAKLNGVEADRRVSVFMAMDNVLFVELQSAKDIASMRSARSRLHALHVNAPPQVAAEARVLFDFHDYCSRVRLAELEEAHFGSSQS